MASTKAQNLCVLIAVLALVLVAVVVDQKGVEAACQLGFDFGTKRMLAYGLFCNFTVLWGRRGLLSF